MEHLTLSDLPKKAKIITLNPTENIPSVLQKLFSNQITSAPVIDKEKRILGSISIIDIINFSLNICQTSQELVKLFGVPTDESFQFVDFQSLKNYLITENNIPYPSVADSADFLTNYSHQNKLVVFKPNASFKDLLITLSTVYRVAIGDENILDYISQSEVVKFLYERGVLSLIGSKTIEELHLGSKDLISVKDNQRVIEAFKLMVLNKVSGIAVTDEKGQLIGQISSSDIKNITPSGDMLSILYDTYHPFRKILLENFKVPEKTITVKSGATLTEVLHTIIRNKLHRIFIIGNDNQAEGVITLTDIIKLIITHSYC
jgi:CBS domain-containing protein